MSKLSNKLKDLIECNINTGHVSEWFDGKTMKMSDSDLRIAKIIGLMMSAENEIAKLGSGTSSIIKKISGHLKLNIINMSDALSEIGDMYKAEMLKHAREIENKVDGL